MPMFARRHYEFLATVLGNASREGATLASAQDVIELLLYRLQAENPGFKRARFCDAIDKARYDHLPTHQATRR